MLVLWSAELYRLPAQAAARRGAALAALRGVPRRRASGRRAPLGPAPPEPAGRPGTATGGWRASACRPAGEPQARRLTLPTRTQAGNFLVEASLRSRRLDDPVSQRDRDCLELRMRMQLRHDVPDVRAERVP